MMTRISKSKWQAHNKINYSYNVLLAIGVFLVDVLFYLQKSWIALIIVNVALVIYVIIIGWGVKYDKGKESIEFRMEQKPLFNLIETILTQNNVQFEKQLNGTIEKVFLWRFIEKYYLLKYDLLIEVRISGYNSIILVIGRKTDKNAKVRRYLKGKLRKEIFSRVSKTFEA